MKRPTLAMLKAILQEERKLADAGEAAGVFLHEIGNLLNNLLLDSKLMQRELPAEFHERLAENCTIITKTAKDMQKLAAYRQSCRTVPYATDLQDAIDHAWNDLGESVGTIKKQIKPKHIHILAAQADLQRFFRCAFAVLQSRATEESEIHIDAQSNDGQLSLEIHAEKLEVHDSKEDDWFELFSENQPQGMGLHLAICRSIARRCRAQFKLETNDERSMRMLMHFPTAVADQSKS